MKQLELKDYQHSRDSGLMAELMETSGIEKLSELIQEYDLEHVCRYCYDASYIKLTAASAPELFREVKTACGLLGIRETPVVYLTRDYDSAITLGGFSQPFLVVSSTYLSKIDAGARFGILAAYLSGICAGHQVPLFFESVLGIVSSYLPGVLIAGIDASINNWKRCRYFTYDRVFYLATRDASLSLRQIFYPILPDEELCRYELESQHSLFEVQCERFYAVNEAMKGVNSLASEKSWLPERYREIRAFMKEKGER